MFGLLRSLVTATSVFPSHVLVLGDSVTTAAHTGRSHRGEHTAAHTDDRLHQSIVKLTAVIFSIKDLSNRPF